MFAMNSAPRAPTDCSSAAFLKLPLFFSGPPIESVPLLSEGLFSFLIKAQTVFLAFVFSLIALVKHANCPSELQPHGS